MVDRPPERICGELHKSRGPALAAELEMVSIHNDDLRVRLAEQPVNQGHPWLPEAKTRKPVSIGFWSMGAPSVLLFDQ